MTFTFPTHSHNRLLTTRVHVKRLLLQTYIHMASYDSYHHIRPCDHYRPLSTNYNSQRPHSIYTVHHTVRYLIRAAQVSSRGSSSLMYSNVEHSYVHTQTVRCTGRKTGIELGIYDLNTSVQTTEPQIPDNSQSSHSLGLRFVHLYSSHRS